MTICIKASKTMLNTLKCEKTKKALLRVELLQGSGELDRNLLTLR